MHILRFFTTAVACGGIALHCAVAQDEMGGPEGALATLKDGPGVAVGTVLRYEQRILDFGGGLPGVETAMDVDVFQVLARVGFNPFPPLHLFGEAGWGEAELEVEDDGDGDVAWGAGFQLGLFDFEIESSPVVGRQRRIGLEVAGAYRQVRSDFQLGELKYDEFLAIPSLVYMENRRGTSAWRPYPPSAISGRVGVVLSTIDGDLGAADLKEDQGVGLALGAGWRNWRHTLTDLQALLYDEGDFSLALGFRYLY